MSEVNPSEEDNVFTTRVSVGRPDLQRKIIEESRENPFVSVLRPRFEIEHLKGELRHMRAQYENFAEYAADISAHMLRGLFATVDKLRPDVLRGRSHARAGKRGGLNRHKYDGPSIIREIGLIHEEADRIWKTAPHLTASAVASRILKKGKGFGRAKRTIQGFLVGRKPRT